MTYSGPNTTDTRHDIAARAQVVSREPSGTEDTVIRWASRPREDFRAWKTYVLVVEDNAAVRDSYRSALRAAGHVVIGAADGVEALRLVASQPPSVIVLDVTLSHLDGHAVLHSLKSTADTRNIPVVVVSGTDISRIDPRDYASLLIEPTTADEIVVAVGNALRDRAEALPQGNRTSRLRT